MDLNALRSEREKWLTWKNILPYQEAIKNLPSYDEVTTSLSDKVEIQIPNLSIAQVEQI